MIYQFTITNIDGITSRLSFCADNEKALYKRIWESYSVTKDRVTITAIYKETDDGYINKNLLRNEDNTKVSKRELKNIEKSKELFHGAKFRQGQKKIDYIKKYNFTEVPITCSDDLIPLLKQYKKVKVYHETGEIRGQHNYYALVK